MIKSRFIKIKINIIKFFCLIYKLNIIIFEKYLKYLKYYIYNNLKIKNNNIK